MQKSIRLLHERIGFALKWSWGIFILANLVFLLLFMLMNILNLKNSSTTWKEFFLDRLAQVESISADGDQGAPIPLVHTLVIAADGTIRKSPSATLQGMRLNNSGFFGKIDHLQPGQKTIIFFPDMVDGIQRVHFVKRLTDEFIVKSFMPSDFFPISLAGDTNLSVVTGGVIWFSDDPSQIGDLYNFAPIYIDSGRLYTAFSDQIPEMPDAALVIRQDITNQMLILLITASILMFVFGSASLLTMKIQKDFTVLQAEQRGITQFIQTLSTAILRSDEMLPTRLENLAPIVRQSFSAAHDTGSTILQFEENQQVRFLVQKLTEDILLLMDRVEDDGAKLRESEARFRAVVEHSSNGVVFMSAERQISYVSPAYPKFLGYTPQEMVGHFGMEFIHSEDLAFTTKAFREFLQTPTGTVIVEYRLQRKDGSYCWVETTAANLLADPDVQAVVLNQRDISERKQAEVAQRDSEERYRTLADATFEAIVITENGLILDVNKQFLQMFGYDMTEILGRHLSEFVIPDEIDFLRKVIASGKEMVREYTIIKKDGTKISIEAHGREIEHSQRRLRLTTMRDVTERKLAREQLEKSLQQQHLLSKHLQTIRENERAAVAREIHDELGQALTGLKMELYLIKDMQAKATGVENARSAQRLFQQVAEKLTSAVQDVDATIDVVRNISTSLRPSLLDTLGLVPALEWLAQEFQTHSGVPCSFRVGLKQQDFSQEFSTAVFRICQESLTNITRHAKASRVNISFKSKQADILLEVEDNGCGINEEALKHSNLLGILGMKERAYAFNGSVELKNSQTGGVRVTARFPASEVFRPDY